MIKELTSIHFNNSKNDVLNFDLNRSIFIRKIIICLALCGITIYQPSNFLLKFIYLLSALILKFYRTCYPKIINYLIK